MITEEQQTSIDKTLSNYPLDEVPETETKLSFMVELENLINKYSIGGFTNTTTENLQNYLVNCLETYEELLNGIKR